jgi:hypothetical protein
VAELRLGDWVLVLFFSPCGWVILLAILATAVWLWFAIGGWRDRRYMERIEHGRCWKCNYNVCGIESDRCPECGMPITRPWRQTIFTRK